MARLEDLTTGAQVRGLTPEGTVVVKSVQWYGDQAVEVIFDAGGRLDRRLVYRGDEPSLELVAGGEPQ